MRKKTTPEEIGNGKVASEWVAEGRPVDLLDEISFALDRHHENGLTDKGVDAAMRLLAHAGREIAQLREREPEFAAANAAVRTSRAIQVALRVLGAAAHDAKLAEHLVEDLVEDLGATTDHPGDD